MNESKSVKVDGLFKYKETSSRKVFLQLIAEENGEVALYVTAAEDWYTAGIIGRVSGTVVYSRPLTEVLATLLETEEGVYETVHP